MYIFFSQYFMGATNIYYTLTERSKTKMCDLLVLSRFYNIHTCYLDNLINNIECVDV